MHIFFNQKTSAVKKSITPLGHLRCIASHFWERSLGITGASHLKTCNSTSKQLSLCRVPGASQDWVNWDCRLVGTYLVKCGNMDGNGVSWFLSAAYPSISQGAPNSVWPCSSQRHFALPALGSLHIGKIGANNLMQSDISQPSTTWKWDSHVTSGSFAQSLLSPPFRMVFISGFM